MLHVSSRSVVKRSAVCLGNVKRISQCWCCCQLNFFPKI